MKGLAEVDGFVKAVEMCGKARCLTGSSVNPAFSGGENVSG
jgi:hypothetical protein